VVTGPSCNQACDKGAEQGFAASASVVHELDEAKVGLERVRCRSKHRARPTLYFSAHLYRLKCLRLIQ